MARELPHSTEAEQAILGAMLVYPSVVNIAVDQDLQADEFYLDDGSARARAEHRCRDADHSAQ